MKQIAEIIKKHPHLKGYEDFIKTVVEIREAFNCKENFRITANSKVIGNVKEKIIVPPPPPRRRYGYKKRQVYKGA